MTCPAPASVFNDHLFVYEPLGGAGQFRNLILPMKISNLFLLFCLFSATLTFGQKGSKWVDSWHREGVPPRSFSRIGIVAFTPNMANRATLEQEMEVAFQDKKLNGISTFDMFPLAGHPEIFDEQTEAEVQERVKQALEKYGIDALMTVALFDTQQEERYRQGPSFTISAPVYSAPAYGYNYYQYYSIASATLNKPGYYETSSTYFLEFNLYDRESEELIWTGQSQTTDPRSIGIEAGSLGKLVVKDLLKKKVLEKP